MEKTKCKYCRKNFTAIGVHLNKCKYNEDRVNCTFCNGTYVNINAHIEKCKKNPSNAEYLCRFCDSLYKDRTKHESRCKKNPSNTAEGVCKHCYLIIGADLESHEVLCDYNPDCIQFSDNSITFFDILLNSNHSNNISSEYENLKIMNQGVAEALSVLASNMGYLNTDEMLEENNLLCPVCYNPTKNKLSCEHSLCEVCLRNILKTNNMNCPLCRKSIIDV